MAQAMVSFRMDKDLKKTMEEYCKAMGLTLTSAFTMFAAKVVKDKGIPFEVRVAPAEADPFYSEENLAHVECGIRQIEEGRMKPLPLDELKDFAYD